MNPCVPFVCHETLESLVGQTWDDCRKAIDQSQKIMKREDLLVHIVVLAHGDDESRNRSTMAMVRMLQQEVATERVRVWLSYQGQELPASLAGLRLELADRLVMTGVTDLNGIPTQGKTENILQVLKNIFDRNLLPADRQFVTFLDNDYSVYDPVNAQSIYLPWVFNKGAAHGAGRDQLYVKGGGMRYRLEKSFQERLPLRDIPLTFFDLCSESLQFAGQESDELLKPFEGSILAPSVFEKRHDPVAVSMLESALSQTTRQGARSSRGLSCYLQAHRDNPIAKYLSEFTFLLHGDQGTSLANWMAASLMPGYGLELAFLQSAMQNKGSVVINSMGLPHAHHPKDEAENFALGMQMFALVEGIIEPGRALRHDAGTQSHWTYYLPGKLGLQAVQMRPPRTGASYAPLRELLRDTAAIN